MLQTKARYRFRTVSVHRYKGIVLAKVRVLIDEIPVPSQVITCSYQSAFRCAVNPFPLCVYTSNCPYVLSSRAIQLLESSSSFQSRQSEKRAEGQKELLLLQARTDPVAFAYTLCSHLPLSDTQRQKLLSASSVVHRLQILLQELESTSDTLACSHCAQNLVSTKELYTVPGAEGQVVCCAFCNVLLIYKPAMSL